MFNANNYNGKSQLVTSQHFQNVTGKSHLSQLFLAHLADQINHLDSVSLNRYSAETVIFGIDIPDPYSLVGGLTLTGRNG